MYGKYNLAERNKEHFYPLNLTPYLLLSSLFCTPPVVPNLLVLYKIPVNWNPLQTWLPIYHDPLLDLTFCLVPRVLLYVKYLTNMHTFPLLPTVHRKYHWQWNSRKWYKLREVMVYYRRDWRVNFYHWSLDSVQVGFISLYSKIYSLKELNWSDGIDLLFLF